MECSEDRGIESQGVCFNLVDGKIVLAVYQNLPGIERHLAGTTFLRAFTIDDWEDINGYLRDMEMREVILGEEEEEDEVLIAQENLVSSTTDISAKADEELSKVNSIPSMTKSKDEANDGSKQG